MPPNRLARETSPYLLQHAHNPVDWFPWGDEAFARARAEDKPILLSIGYSSCHWCHVMERESFENPDIAALMNELFVNIKVDREERPDVDDVYMKAVQLLIRHGGWPLTVFLTPDRKPFHGGTYFPPVDRHGMPAFPRVLRAVAQAYRDRRDEVDRAVTELSGAIQAIDRNAPTTQALDPALPGAAAAALLSHVDAEHGGLGGAPKFPHTRAFQLLLRHWRRSGDDRFRDATRVTADAMARGGVYDQIGGGFHRYAVDAEWLVPHFEKMLYDNAELPRLYVDLWQATGDPSYRAVAEDVLEYLLRDMRHEGGAFFSATDADSEGHEGRFFVWSHAEVETIVDPADAELVCAYWDVTDAGNFEGANIPHPVLTVDEAATRFGRSPDDVRATLARARAALFAVRAQRVPPLRDEKILAAWNGLAIGAFATAGASLRVPRFVEAACRALDFVWAAMRDGDRLRHQWAGGEAKGEAYLDDHAFLAAAALDCFEATGDPRFLRRAEALVAALEARFHDDARGGYFFTPHDGEPLLVRTTPGADGAIPSGNAVATKVLLRLHHLTGADAPRERAEELLHLFYDAARKNPFAYATYLEAFELYTEGPTEIVVVGAPGHAATEALWATVGRTYLPQRLVVPVAPGAADVPAVARDRPAVGGRPTAYVCRGFSCSAPVHDPAALSALLAG